MIKSWFIFIFLAYLRLCAQLQLLKNPRATIIGITGSSGKSSAKQAIASILQDYYQIKICDHGNSESGIPLDILGIEIYDYSVTDWIRIAFLAPWKLFTNWESYQVLIIEMGIDSITPPKNMGYLLSILRPHIGVFLSVSTVHAANFDRALKGKYFPTPQAYDQAIRSVIAQEKGKLITTLPSTGFAILNEDEPLISSLASSTKADHITYGHAPTSTVRIVDISVAMSSGFRMIIEINNLQYEIDFPDQVLGDGYAHTFAAAIAVGQALKVTPEQSIRSLTNNFQLPPSRLNLLRGLNDSYLLDSTYNSSVYAALDAIELCRKLESPYKIAVLGDLREVGEAAALSHQQVAEAALQVFNQIVFVGPLFQKFLESKHETRDPVRNTTAPSPITHFVPTALQVLPLIKDHITPSTLILLKGSQNTIYLEYVVAQLLANPSDISKLCRQSDYWKSVKRQFFQSSSVSMIKN